MADASRAHSGPKRSIRGRPRIRGRARGRGRALLSHGSRGGRAGAATESGHKYVIRGIYDEAEEDPEWRQVPTFDTKEEALAFSKEHIETTCTNPKYPQCCHVFTTLCDWEQVQHLLLPKLAEYRRKLPVRPPPPLSRDNAFARHKGVVDNVRLRADLPFHRATNEESTLNTLRYCFFHMRCGIFVMIRQRRVVMFAPFVNRHYRNTWSKFLTLDHGNSLDSYYSVKRRQNRPEDIIPDTAAWWANGNIICNVESDNFWGDMFLTQLKEMLQACCRERDVPDCEFFVNKRDFPNLKANLSEPYDFLFPRDDYPRTNEMYSTYAPIMSFFVANNFADFPWPNTDDWETATGLVYPPRGIDLRSKKKRESFSVDWKDKLPTAVFRGNSTGGGVTPETNQRLHLALLSQQWEKDPNLNDDNPIDGVRYLDAGVVQWNIRDKKIQGEAMTFLDKKAIAQRVRLANRIPMFEQAKYKYLIYVEGHCAAARYASLMAFGSVIIKVESLTQAKDMWYFPLLTPFSVDQGEMNPLADHVSVKSDLSDLAASLRWLKEHDDKAQLIVENANALAVKYLHKEGILDYMHLCLHAVASRFTSTSTRAAAPRAGAGGAGAGAAAGSGGGASAAASPGAAAGDGDGDDSDKDWFGPENLSYCDQPLPVPPAGKHAHLISDCPCRRCLSLEASAAAAAHPAPVSSGAGGGGAKARSAKKRRRPLVKPGKVARPKFQMSAQKKALLLAAAAKAQRR